MAVTLRDKKMKKGRTSSNGHLGCSSYFNYMEYKKYEKAYKDGAVNSQGREQLHSILDRQHQKLNCNE